MTVKDIDADTHATFPAVSEGLYATNSAETTFVAMERFLGFSHPEIANIAVVFSEDCAACDADIAVKQSREKTQHGQKRSGRNDRVLEHHTIIDRSQVAIMLNLRCRLTCVAFLAHHLSNSEAVHSLMS